MLDRMSRTIVYADKIKSLHKKKEDINRQLYYNYMEASMIYDGKPWPT